MNSCVIVQWVISYRKVNIQTSEIDQTEWQVYNRTDNFRW
jgi:hypothetical protein